MSYVETELFKDDILQLAKDPELNREKGKTQRLVRLIHNFPPAERKVSRLCELSLNILKTLEKMELTLKNWAFLSLDINSAHHFDRSNPENIKSFNNNVSVRVITSCQDLTVKLNKITADMDFVTKASRSLSPREFISDSGTLLTSLTLRNIRLKDELREKVTVAYSKAKLITIGTNLEAMLEGGTDDQKSTVSSYQHFVVSLLGQLNQAIDEGDEEEKNECLAIIADMEQMFEVFKLEYAQAPQENWLEQDDSAVDDDCDSSTSALSSSHSQLHSITKHEEAPKRRGSFSSVTTSSLQKSTLAEELPYLMSAFNSAKTIEEDVHHFKEEEPEQVVPEPRSPKKKSFTRNPHLPESPLYSDSQILKAPQSPSYLYNNSLLSKLGIKPQVITAPLPKTAKSEDKENAKDYVSPLTKANLASHLTALTASDISIDVPDFVE